MFKQLSVIAALALFCAPVVFAQTAPVAGETRGAAENDDLDRPAAPMKVILPPAGAPAGAPGTPVVPPTTDVPPLEGENPQVPPTETIEPPNFFGEPLSGKFIWCLDRSGSMMSQDSGSGPIEGAGGDIITSPSRIAIVKAECIKVLSQLTEEDKFAIVTFGASPEWTWYQDMVYATSGNKQQAITEVNQMVANGWTPAFHALELSCQYDIDTNKLFFLCDGDPNSGGGAAAILSAFPNWFQPMKDNGCTLVCVHIGTSGSSAAFMQDLANSNGGTYIHK
jgi:hypothetical protein